MKIDQVRTFAKKTFLALDNPNDTVVKVFPDSIDKVKSNYFSYIGVKNRPEIPHSLVHLFETTGNYALHTLDAFSLGGRAIDVRINNPITGLPMTGSSSGSAINVLLGINDLGIGTDGGGSVLAPAISLNLFSFISPSIEKEHTDKFKKDSTDSHSFTPSIGFITREFDELKRAIETVIPSVEKSENKDSHNILEVNHALSSNENPLSMGSLTNTPINLDDSRENLLTFLNDKMDIYDLIVSYEGPVDFHGLGDSVLGHMGKKATSFQNKGNKGLIKVANMANLAALTIPTSNHAESYVLLTKDTPENIYMMVDTASKLAIKQNPLLKKYFMNFDHYYPEDF